MILQKTVLDTVLKSKVVLSKYLRINLSKFFEEPPSAVKTICESSSTVKKKHFLSASPTFTKLVVYFSLPEHPALKLKIRKTFFFKSEISLEFKLLQHFWQRILFCKTLAVSSRRLSQACMTASQRRRSWIQIFSVRSKYFTILTRWNWLDSRHTRNCGIKIKRHFEEFWKG